VTELGLAALFAPSGGLVASFVAAVLVVLAATAASLLPTSVRTVAGESFCVALTESSRRLFVSALLATSSVGRFPRADTEALATAGMGLVFAICEMYRSKAAVASPVPVVRKFSITKRRLEGGSPESNNLALVPSRLHLSTKAVVCFTTCSKDELT